MKMASAGIGLLGRSWIWLKKYGPYLILYISSLIMVLWPFFDAFFSSLKPAPIFLVGIAVGCLTLLASDFYNLLADFHSDLKRLSPIEHMSINEAIRNTISKWGSDPIKEVRIFASTTEVILPAIRECKHQINSCKVFIQDFDPNSSDKKIQMLSIKISGFIESWFDLVDQGILKEVFIYQTTSTPNFYAVIFEQSFMVFGLFVPAALLKAHAVDFDEPVVIDGTTESGRKLIIKFCKQYDCLCTLARQVVPSK
jgi:hypothetical protein